MKKLLALVAVVGLGVAMLGCAEDKKPVPSAVKVEPAPMTDNTPAPAPAAAPAADEKK